ncbi:MAG: hypothetical protein OXH56_12000 [Gemmatimonadetes bacterium]|nr:hypothetical protein [Gemmatimonadota bacterium]
MDSRDDWERAEHDYVQCLKRLEAARADLDAARKALLDLTPEEGRSGRLLNVRYRKNRGAVDWRAALHAVLESDEVALDEIGDKYRKPESGAWYVRLNRLAVNAQRPGG